MVDSWQGGRNGKSKNGLAWVHQKIANPVTNCGAHYRLYLPIEPIGIFGGVNSLPVSYFSLGFPLQTVGCRRSRHRYWGRNLVFFRETSGRPATKGNLDFMTLPLSRTILIRHSRTQTGFGV